ncbi:hypothetical protein [Pantoea sp. 18069]|uniref:hypothetical protein n=1 Tax=Pantoea sp. 18069 TaxID=2681415 RepID=UPI001358CE60|nr:hypothetical protein [Pantoea sp. 18069]
MSTHLSLPTNAALTLSSSRIAKLMDGDAKEATKLGYLDSFLDLFRSNSKEAALKHLHEMLHDGGTSNFARFNMLSELAAPGNKALFTLSITDHSGDPDHYMVEYSINGQPIKTDTIDAQERELILLLMGKPLDTALLQEQVATIDQYRLKTEEAVAKVVDENFKGGGVNKKFDAGSGLLRADTKTGEEDFERELALAEYAKDRPELASYISTQKKVTDLSTLHPDLSKDHTYALVDIYDPKHVASTEMDNCIATLSRGQAGSLLPQLVDMTRVLYKNQVAHRDLHMHNLVVHKIAETGSVHLKAIDFGRLAMGEDFEARKFEDIDYLFDKQGATLLETIGRNYLAPAGSEVDKKHYPIHKLCEQFNERGIDLDPVLSGIGERLKHDLTHAGADEVLVDRAFHKASQELQLCFAQLQADNQGIQFA